MSVLGGRGGRSDDWSTPHLRAQARAAERLDAPLDPEEGRWLDDHLSGCPACAAAAADYATQHLELRALRDRAPQPPRDLWARTAASIEREAGHRSSGTRKRSPQSTLAPYALLAGALVVAIAVGTLYSSQPPTRPMATPGASGPITASTASPFAGATPLAVASKEVNYLSRDPNGEFNLNTTTVSEVCAEDVGTCATTEPNEVQSIGPLSSPETVFGSGDAPLVVLGNGENGSSVFAVERPETTATPTSTPEPTASPAQAASSLPEQSPATASPSESAPATSPPASPPIESSPPTSDPSPSASPPAGTVEIAHGVEVIHSTAAYSPDGSAFAFTARPADGSHGPDIYVWNVGDAEATPITSDHRSVFGSWAGDSIVGSTVVTSDDGQTNEPAAFTWSRDGGTNVPLPQAGLAWRPAVDPSEGSAVYWAGTLKPSDDNLGWRDRGGPPRSRPMECRF